MPKRKFEDATDSDTVDAPARRKVPRQGGLDGILDNGKKTLFRAFKVSRGFERQKLGRRQKTAKEQNAPAETARLAQEVIALKTLDFHAVSELHLWKSLLKSKPISTSSAFPAYIAAKVSQSSEPPNTATANVTARLYDSNPVRLALADVLGNVHQELGIAAEEVPLRKKRLRAVDYKDKPSSVTKSQQAAPDSMATTATREKPVKERDSLPRSPQRSASVSDDNASNSESENTDYDQYQSRLADSDSNSDVDDDAELLGSDSWEGIDPTSTQPPPLPPKAIKATPPQYHASPSPSLSPPPPPPPKRTTFLPSLTSGYISGTDSAPSDSEPSAAPPRKNRRGQQERRAIWEKKFGRGAKHLLRAPRQGGRSRDEGWDARRGASDGRGRRGRGGGGVGGRERGGGMRGRERGGRDRERLASGANGEVVSGKRRVGRGGAIRAKGKGDEGPLHPSWEAKKKAKAKAAAGVGAVAFLGKKIVFE